MPTKFEHYITANERLNIDKDPPVPFTLLNNSYSKNYASAYFKCDYQKEIEFIESIEAQIGPIKNGSADKLFTEKYFMTLYGYYNTPIGMNKVSKSYQYSEIKEPKPFSFYETHPSKITVIRD